jgi:protoporphyrinogen oxidase
VSAPLTVLGGGPAGLAVAHHAARAGRDVQLFERADAVGGLCRTLRAGQHLYDSGAHRFHDRDPEVTADVRALLGERLLEVDAPSRIHERGRYFDFPPTPLNVLRGHGARGALRILGELLGSRLDRREIRSFADLARRRFGPTLARRFLLGYSEKLWGLRAERLAPEVATRRLQGLSLATLLAELALPGRRRRHIDGRLLYPRGGYGEIAERLAAGLPPGCVHTGHEVSRLEHRGGRIARVHFAGKPAHEPEGRVVSTLPLPVLLRLLDPPPPAGARAAAAELRFRDVRLVFLRIGRARVSENASIYFPDPELCMTRLVEPKNRSLDLAPADETALVAEVPCFPDDAVGRLDAQELARRVLAEVAQAGLVRPEEVLEWRHHWLHHAYPVYDLGYRQALDTVLAALAPLANLDLLGRGGRFHYSHLHDQLRAARDYAWTGKAPALVG